MTCFEGWHKTLPGITLPHWFSRVVHLLHLQSLHHSSFPFVICTISAKHFQPRPEMLIGLHACICFKGATVLDCTTFQRIHTGNWLSTIHVYLFCCRFLWTPLIFQFHVSAVNLDCFSVQWQCTDIQPDLPSEICCSHRMTRKSTQFSSAKLGSCHHKIICMQLSKISVSLYLFISVANKQKISQTS